MKSEDGEGGTGRQKGTKRKKMGKIGKYKLKYKLY